MLPLLLLLLYYVLMCLIFSLYLTQRYILEITTTIPYFTTPFLRSKRKEKLNTKYLFIQPFYNLQPVCPISVFIEECLRQSSDFFLHENVTSWTTYVLQFII